MPEQTSFAVLILAAGSSSRMGEGRHKLLLPLGNRPVLAYVITAALASQARPVLVIIGHQAEEVRIHLWETVNDPRLTVIENPDYKLGMSTSLRTGIQALMKDSYTATKPTAIGGAIVMLGDQPLMTSQILDALISTRQTTGKRIIAPLYNGKRGNPVLFDASLFPELLAVTGDEGGRSVIEHHREEMATIEAGSAIASYDVDTWEAYQQVVEEWQQQQNNEEGIQ